jgi:hypothetical protein
MPTVWDEAAFKLNESVFGALLAAADRFDFAVFVFEADDAAMIRQAAVKITRDNVLFEFGLFTGRIGPGRAFWISAEGSVASHLPSDLAGIIHLSYKKPARINLNKLRAALQKPCQRLKAQIDELGARADRTIEELVKPQILCAASSQYSEPKFAEDIAQIQSNFPSGSIQSAHGVSAHDFLDYFSAGKRWDLIHLAMYVDADTGDLIIPSADRSGGTEGKDRLPAAGVDSLVSMARARLVVIVTCDSLMLATRIARTTNTIAGYKPIDVRAALNWSSVFYRFLAHGCPLSEAFNRAQTLTDPGLLLLAKRDFRVNLNRAS